MPTAKSPQEQALSPMMQQYFDVKTEYPEPLLFFRVGDFYEMFDQDAKVAAKELDITLTARREPSQANGKMPMAGVPARAVDTYVARLLNKGYSVAICEQVGVVGQDKGPVERKVTKVLTPGTVLESHLLPVKENNYLAAITCDTKRKNWGLAYVDASCGEFYVTQLDETELSLELSRIAPKEVLVQERMGKLSKEDIVPREIRDIPEALEGQFRYVGRPQMFFQLEPSRRRIFDAFKVTTLEGFGCQDMPLAIGAAGAILEYLEHTQGEERPSFEGLSTYSVEGHMILDQNTRKNLELVETSRERTYEGSLLWTIDRTKTSMGARQLRKWLMKPLFDTRVINARQEAVCELVESVDFRSKLDSTFSRFSDLERLSVRLSSGSVSPKDLSAVQLSLEALPELSEIVQSAKSEYLNVFSSLPSELLDLHKKIANSIKEDSPREISQGGIFVTGYNEELDEIRDLLGGGKKWINDYQSTLQDETGVKSLKVSFNKTFGYYIEVTKANQSQVPDSFIRKQTLTNAERYITPELKEYESKILNAEKNQSDLEYKLFLNFRTSLVPFGKVLSRVAKQLSSLDALLSLAVVASERNYIRPQVDDSRVIEIESGRHPVLESILPMGNYVANGTNLKGSSNEDQLIVLTGPNMSGKSSYLRQVALIVILAQIGSYVPATNCRVGIVDRIFTRIGAVDDLTQGQSTFLVEMSETTQCCRSATDRSLILLDEVGRGTSTYDGVAIAWAVAEFLAKDVRARTIFATHYHELNGLSNFLPQISNYQVLVKESKGNVEFIRTVVPGGASKSFGVQVAKMAGLPSEVVGRAQYLINQMEKRGVASKILDGPRLRNIPMDEVMQLSLFEEAKAAKK